MRQEFIYCCISSSEFQSTHPMRDATAKTKKELQQFAISIHASHAGCDARSSDCAVLRHCYFNPRIPCGMRPAVLNSALTKQISIHASHAGCAALADMIADNYTTFHSTHPMRDATFLDSSILLLVFYFNPRIPCGMRLSMGRQVNTR